jgi:hypothetical protein
MAPRRAHREEHGDIEYLARSGTDVGKPAEPVGPHGPVHCEMLIGIDAQELGAAETMDGIFGAGKVSGQ